jgi:hypothetical protein
VYEGIGWGTAGIIKQNGDREMWRGRMEERKERRKKEKGGIPSCVREMLR